MVKNQHYVPRFYLKNFLNKERRFWAFQKDSKKIFQTTPDNVANEKFFYDLPIMDDALGEEQAIEKYLSTFESIIAPLLAGFLKKVDAREIDSLDEDLRSLLCDFLVLQIIRTKAQREGTIQMNALLKTNLIESGWLSETQINEIKSSNVDETAKRIQLERIVSDGGMKGEFSAILKGHIWLLFKNLTKTPYYTSDHPVIKIPHVDRSPRSNNGYKSNGIEVAIPLSSTHLLVLLERTHFKDFEKYENEVMVHYDEANVTYYNSLQVSQSYRTLICQDNDFELAIEMATKDPHLRDLNRPRYGVL